MEKKTQKICMYTCDFLSLYLNLNHTFHILEAEKKLGPTYFEHFEIGI